MPLVARHDALWVYLAYFILTRIASRAKLAQIERGLISIDVAVDVLHTRAICIPVLALQKLKVLEFILHDPGKLYDFLVLPLHSYQFLHIEACGYRLIRIDELIEAFNSFNLACLVKIEDERPVLYAVLQKVCVKVNLIALLFNDLRVESFRHSRQ